MPRLFALLTLAVVVTLHAQPPKEEEDAPRTPVGRVPRLEDDAPVKLPDGVLVVGVRELPERMSPTFARTPAERFALDLLFESLVIPTVDPIVGLSYRPGLATALPDSSPQGRTIELVPDAVWATPDNHRVTAIDVRATVDRLRDRASQPGAEDGAHWEPVTSDSLLRCRFALRQPAIDPLAHLTFPIVPEFLNDDLKFAENPVGSGPYRYAGRKSFAGRTVAAFVANPQWAKRAGHRPQLAKEVWMLASSAPANDFSTGRVHALLEASTPELLNLRTAGRETPNDGPRLEVNLGIDAVTTLPSRRIHFLAINHAESALGGDAGVKLRRLIAHAIQRETILDEVYRFGFKNVHKALAGPFPPNTWPCPATLPTFDDAGLAKALADGIPAQTLTLKLPDNDPLTERACDLIAKQITAAHAGLTIKLVKLPPEQLRVELYEHGRYELAFLTHDYPDDWFDLSGLIAPKATGLGNRNVLALRSWQDVPLARAATSRDFGEVQNALKRLHIAFRDDVPFVPLWTLDAHLVFQKGVRPEPVAEQLDPAHPLRQAGRWRVN